MGVDPEEVFEIVHRANMGKIFPDGKAHFDPVTHKILKPDAVSYTHLDVYKRQSLYQVIKN